MTTLKQTPSQTVGPYFAYGLCPQQYDFDYKSLFTHVLADMEAAGEHITLIGQVFDGVAKHLERSSAFSCQPAPHRWRLCRGLRRREANQQTGMASVRTSGNLFRFRQKSGRYLEQ